MRLTLTCTLWAYALKYKTLDILADKACKLNIEKNLEIKLKEETGRIFIIDKCWKCTFKTYSSNIRRFYYE